MNEYTIQIIAYDRLAILERIFRVIRHRGGHVVEISMVKKQEQLDLSITLFVSKTIETIIAHLNKLNDIECITLA